MINKSFINEKEVTLILQQFEEENDLLQYQLDGWSVWPLLRFGVARALQNVPLDVKKTVISRNELLNIALKDLVGILKLDQASYLVKTFVSARSELYNGKFEDIYFDELLLRLPDFVKIESINKRDLLYRRRNALIEANITTIIPNFLVNCLVRLDKGRMTRSIAIPLGSLIQEKLNLKKYSPEKINIILQNYYWSSRIYRLLLKYIKPKALLLANSGEYPFIIAAKELGVKVVEFQHGFLSRDYPAHSWSTYAKSFKSNMPIPDRIFLFGTHWLKEMEAYGFWKDELRVVGSSRIDKYSKEKDNKKKDVCTILLTTQGTDTSNLITFILKFLNLLVSKFPINLYIKLHPTYDSSFEEYKAKFKNHENVKIFAPTSSKTTFELLKKSDLHLSIFSTCHYEALGLGVPTIILPLTGYETVRHLYESGNAHLARNPQELFDLVIHYKELVVPEKIREKYFQQNAINNMLTELAVL